MPNDTEKELEKLLKINLNTDFEKLFSDIKSIEDRIPDKPLKTFYERQLLFYDAYDRLRENAIYNSLSFNDPLLKKFLRFFILKSLFYGRKSESFFDKNNSSQNISLLHGIIGRRANAFFELGELGEGVSYKRLRFEKSKSEFKRCWLNGNYAKENYSKWGGSCIKVVGLIEDTTERYKNLLESIINFEWSRQRGNRSLENLCFIANSYLSLGHLVSDLDLLLDSSEQADIIKFTKEVINQRTEEDNGKFLKSCNVVGSLSDLITYGCSNRNVVESVSLKILEHSLSEYDEIHRHGSRAENYSYRGRCFLYLSKLTNSKEYLGKAISDLKEAEQIRGGLSEILSEECILRGECEFLRAHMFCMEPDERKSAFLESLKYYQIAQKKGKSEEWMLSNIYYHLLKSSLGVGRSNLIYAEKYFKKIRKFAEQGVQSDKNSFKFSVSPYLTLVKTARFLETPGVRKIIEQNGLENKFTLPKNSGEYLSEGVKCLIDIGKLNLLGLARGANETMIPIDEYGLISRFLVLKRNPNDDISKLQQEMFITSNLQNFLNDSGNVNRFSVPTPIDILSIDGNFWYAMTREGGVTLDAFLSDERDSKNRDKILSDVIDYLAFIHVKLSSSESHQDYKSKLEERLSKLETLSLIDPFTKTQIVDNYSPLLDSFAGANLVFNKDAHPGNWIITRDGKIVTVDLEDKIGSVPIEFDLVNLLGFNETPTSLKEKLVKFYTSSFEGYSGRKFVYDEKRYQNAFIHQAISVVSTNASKEKARYTRCISFLNKILDSIHGFTQSTDSIEYLKLYRGFEKVKDRFLEFRSNN